MQSALACVESIPFFAHKNVGTVAVFRMALTGPVVCIGDVPKHSGVTLLSMHACLRHEGLHKLTRITESFDISHYGSVHVICPG